MTNAAIFRKAQKFLTRKASFGMCYNFSCHAIKDACGWGDEKSEKVLALYSDIMGCKTRKRPRFIAWFGNCYEKNLLVRQIALDFAALAAEDWEKTK
jgi:hypothetical protein